MAEHLLAALGLVFVIEGLLPFISPNAWRNLMQALSKQDNRSIRVMGLFSMILGVIILYLYHWLY